MIPIFIPKKAHESRSKWQGKTFLELFYTQPRCVVTMSDFIKNTLQKNKLYESNSWIDKYICKKLLVLVVPVRNLYLHCMWIFTQEIHLHTHLISTVSNSIPSFLHNIWRKGYTSAMSKFLSWSVSVNVELTNIRTSRLCCRKISLIAGDSSCDFNYLKFLNILT